LLFVAGSLRPETLLGRDAPPAAKAISGSAFTALFNSFFVALIALIPSTSLGCPAAVMALVSLYST
jgi:ABC-type phosphate transport system permease subunit